MKIKRSLMAKEGIIIAVSERLKWMAAIINEVKRFSYLWWNTPSQMQLPHPESFWNTWIVSNFTLMYGWFKSLELRISGRMLSKTMSYGYSKVMGQYFDTIDFRRFCFIWGGGLITYSINLNKVKTFLGNKNVFDIFHCAKEK
jgi:hypothetical protein